jgi:branched-chain amino acid transport system permease protein
MTTLEHAQFSTLAPNEQAGQARIAATILLFVFMTVLPFVFRSIGQPFLLDALTRTVILAIAAVGLSFLVFTAGLVSFGHAAFFGIGAYSVAICDYYGYTNGFLHLVVSMGAAGLFALGTGWLAIRTRGIHFIMLTLAFSQVLYYVILGLKEYGSDDGITLAKSSQFPLLHLADKLTLYWTALVVLILQLLFFAALRQSRFGLVLSAAKDCERRVQNSGLNVFQYRLVAYMIAGSFSSLSGLLSANLTSFVTPDGMDWIRSGDLLFVITLGGMGTNLAPLVGSALFVFLEEFLSAVTVYWHFWFGAFLILAVMTGLSNPRTRTFSLLRRKWP